MKFGEHDGEVELKYEGKQSKFLNFVKENFYPLMGPRGIGQTDLMAGIDTALMIRADEPEGDEKDKYDFGGDANLIEIAKKLKESGARVGFIPDKWSEKQGIEENPAYMMYRRKKGKDEKENTFDKYLFQPKKNEGTDLQGFIDNVMADDWPMHYNSEPLPDYENSKENVYTLVGSNFEEHIR